jgi:hypothetical protein
VGYVTGDGRRETGDGRYATGTVRVMHVLTIAVHMGSNMGVGKDHGSKRAWGGDANAVNHLEAPFSGLPFASQYINTTVSDNSR